MILTMVGLVALLAQTSETGDNQRPGVPDDEEKS